MSTQFKDPTLRRQYDHLKNAYRLQSKPIFRPDGTRDAASWEATHFWTGFDQTVNGWDETGKRTLGYACWRAGRDSARLRDGGDFNPTATPRFFPARELSPEAARKQNVGYYVTPERLDPTLREVAVGPFTVRLTPRGNYTLFTCDVLGVSITRQISYPSLGQLARDLSNSKVPAAEVERLWKQVIQAGLS